MTTQPLRSAGRDRLLRLLGVLSIISSLVLGVTATTASAANPGAFSPEPGKNTYTTKTTLSANCPEGIAGTPGSDPANKEIVSGDFTPGGVIHYVYHDNPNDDSQNFNLEDCVVSYPADKFSAADFSATGQLVNAFSKSDLTKDATELDKATLTGVTSSTGDIFFSWTAPSSITPGEWVCNFARDTSTGHGGGGNRKVNPTCYQAQGPTDPGAVTLTTSEECDVLDYYTIPTTPNVTYKIGATTVAAGNHNLAEGQSVTITAHTQSPYFFAPGAVTSWQFTGGDVEECEEPPPVTPAAVTVNRVCGAEDTFTIPAVAGVEYFIDGSTTPATPGIYPLPPGTVVDVTAAAAAGRVLSEGATTSWPDLTGQAVVPCPITPQSPTHTVVTTCGVADSYTIPAQAGVQYKVNGVDKAAGTYSLGAGETITITAVPIAPNTFVQGATTSWGPSTGSAIETCGGGGGSTPPPPTEAEPANPRVIRECGEEDQYRIPSRDGIVYRVDGVVTAAGTYDLPEGETVVITAHPQSGYTIPADEDTEWTFTGRAMEECPVEEEPEVPVEEPAEPEPAVVEPEPATPAEPAPAPAPAPVLAFTGFETMELLMAALLMLGIGVALVVASKRELRL